MKLTLDWNCIIEIEERRPQAAHVIGLVQMHRQGKIEVALLAASASENLKSKRFPGNASLFHKRVAAVGLQDLPIVRMPGIIGLSYWGFCYYVKDSEEFDRDIEALWQAIAPKVARDWLKHLPPGKQATDEAIQSEELSKWRNTWCDVMSAYSHIRDGRDLFVTNNTKDFQKNFERLARLGMKHISTPAEAIGLIQRLTAE